ncbi:MAG: zinc ABC transporter substrate-binding protein [Campylobacterales bacterium]|nr:zinc ABC transporter substrate-binding protein [Campylobacterales bacterium]
MKSLKNFIFLAVIIVVIVFAVISKEEQKLEVGNNKRSVGVSTFALYDVAKYIASDTQDIFMIIPFGADVHSFEPSPKLMAMIQKAPLIIYSGTGLQPWIEDIDFEHRALDMSHYMKLRKTQHSHNHHDEHDDYENHKEGALDHHYWLDADNMIKMANMVTRELIVLSPKNKEIYEKNRDQYIDMIKKLDSDFKNSLSNCKKDTIIVNHDAFSYLSSRYGFETLALSGLSPDAQPDANTMIELIEHIKEDNLTTVFFESFASDKAIKSIASETGASVEVLQPLGNITADEAKKDLSYEQIMRENLRKISKALECN